MYYCNVVLQQFVGGGIFSILGKHLLIIDNDYDKQT